MEQAKRFFVEHFEVFVVLVLVVATAFAIFVVVNKVAFLNFFYIPTLVAAYFLGRKGGVLTGAVSILLVTLYAVLDPSLFASSLVEGPYVNLMLWGSFLMITAIVVGSLYEVKEEALENLKEAYDGVLEILAKYIDAVDHYTKDHSVRVANLGQQIAAELGLPEHEVQNIKVAGLLHDVGKIDVSLDLLTKASSLSEDEWEHMKEHTVHGASALEPVGGLLKDAIPIVLYHHERYDGSGYHGKVGVEIPIGARVLAVADAYDSMVTDRPYRTGRTPWEATLEVERHSGTQFDPKAVRAFSTIMRTELPEVQPIPVA